MLTIKGEVRRLLEEVEKLKLQEQVLRTSFRVQKGELESKVSELITMVLGSTSFDQGD